MNCILYKPNTNEIIHFIKDCVVKNRINQKGLDYIGSDKKLMSIKPEHWSIKWTNDDQTESKKVSDYTECDTFENSFIGNNIDINNKIKEKIREKYTIEDEIKLLRKKIMNILSDEEWNEYITWCEDLINKGNIAKNKLRK